MRCSYWVTQYACTYARPQGCGVVSFLKSATSLLIGNQTWRKAPAAQNCGFSTKRLIDGAPASEIRKYKKLETSTESWMNADTTPEILLQFPKNEKCGSTPKV